MGLERLEAFRPRGVVFDLDGTIVDNMALHAEAFATVARADEVPRGKPFPDVFLAAASALRVDAAACLALEDAPAGVAAANAAGMACVAITTSFRARTLLDHGADAALPDFEAFLAGPGRWLPSTP